MKTTRRWTREVVLWPILVTMGLMVSLSSGCGGRTESSPRQASPTSGREPRLRATLKGHTADVECVAFSPDGRLLASGSQDDTVRVWDVTSGENSVVIEAHLFWTLSVAFSPDGKTLVSGGKTGTIKLWDVESRRELSTLDPHNISAINSVDFSRDGKTLVSANVDGILRLWDLSTGENSATFKDGSADAFSVTFSHDGKALICGYADGTVRIWDIKTASCISRIKAAHQGGATAIALSPDGKTLASASEREETLVLWDMPSGERTTTLKARFTTRLAFSPDGKTLAGGSYDQNVRLWDVSSEELYATLGGHTSIVNSVAFSPDGKLLASSSGDNTIKLWDLKSGAGSGEE